jgi:hypothetical protein
MPSGPNDGCWIYARMEIKKSILFCQESLLDVGAYLVQLSVHPPLLVTAEKAMQYTSILIEYDAGVIDIRCQRKYLIDHKENKKGGNNNG